MEITFKNKKMESYARNQRLCQKEMGKQRSDLFLRRISELSAATVLEDVRYLPGHYHELSGDRKGQWACDLDQPYRLIFVPHENPIPEDEHHRYLWMEIQGVEIIEIVNYHKEK